MEEGDRVVSVARLAEREGEETAANGEAIVTSDAEPPATGEPEGEE
jgi:hypothetical protein